MKAKIYIENEQAYNWAYENDLSLVNWKMAEYLGYNDLWHESYCPAEIEVEFELIPASVTKHPYGSTVAPERHGAEITGVEVDGKPVTVPRWLNDKLMEKL